MKPYRPSREILRGITFVLIMAAVTALTMGVALARMS